MHASSLIAIGKCDHFLTDYYCCCCFCNSKCETQQTRTRIANLRNRKFTIFARREWCISLNTFSSHYFFFPIAISIKYYYIGHAIRSESTINDDSITHQILKQSEVFLLCLVLALLPISICGAMNV